METTIKILTENLELFKQLNTNGEQLQIGNYTNEITELEKVISVLSNGFIEDGDLVLKEIYSGIGLESNDNETIGICMRDSGFEFKYDNEWYSAKNGVVEKLSCSGEQDGKIGMVVDEKIEQLLFQIYETGMKHEECNLTNYYDEIINLLATPKTDETTDVECECKKEWLQYDIEKNTFPYGETITYVKCSMCGKRKITEI